METRDTTTRGGAAGPEMATLRERWEARRGHFGDEVRAHRSALVRALYVVAGTVSLATGVIGIFVPLLPTTVFVLMAAACYVKASPTLYDKVLSNRVVGLPVYTWRVNRTIPPHIKVFAIAVVVLTFATTIGFAIRPLWARLAMTALGLALVTFLARIPTTRSRSCPVMDAARHPERRRST